MKSTVLKVTEKTNNSNALLVDIDINDQYKAVIIVDATTNEITVPETLQAVERLGVTVDYSEVYEACKKYITNRAAELINKKILAYNNNCFVKYAIAHPDTSVNVTLEQYKNEKYSTAIALIYKAVEITYNNKVYSGSSFYANTTDKCYVVHGSINNYKTQRFSSIESAIKYIDKKIEEKQAAAIAKEKSKIASTNAIESKRLIIEQLLSETVTAKTTIKSHGYGRSYSQYESTAYTIVLPTRTIPVSVYGVDNEHINVAGFEKVTLEQAKQLIQIFK